jgi:hypothetical protein
VTELIALIENQREFANVVAAISSSVAAVASLIISIVSLWVAHRTLTHQRRHDVASLRPIAEVACFDGENHLRVTLRNNGVGPLLVTRLVAGDGSSVKSSILEWMPNLPDEYTWTTFAGRVDGRSIPPEGVITLIELEGDPEDEEFSEHRDSVRSALRGLTVNVEFSNIFETPQRPYRQPLKWFGRHLEEDELGAGGTHQAEQSADQQQRRQAERLDRDLMKELQAIMPQLLDEMRKDVSQPGNEAVREVFLAPTRGNSLWVEHQVFIYYESDHQELRNQVALLEAHGLLKDITEKHTPRFVMQERFVRLLKAQQGGPVSSETDEDFERESPTSAR